jgi:hypothetical protein
MNNERTTGWSGDGAPPGADYINEFERAAPVPLEAADAWHRGDFRRDTPVERSYLGWWPSLATFAQDLAVGLGLYVEQPSAWPTFVEGIADEYIVLDEVETGGVNVFEDIDRSLPDIEPEPIVPRATGGRP